jgi:hypothetical protein
VPRFAAVSRHHVTSALTEQEATTRHEEFVLMHGGQAYGAQAVLSAAHQKATGSTVPDHDWTTKDQAARILRELGFRVLAGDDPEAVVPVSGEWRETSDVGPEATREEWAAAARETLLESARRYRATIAPKDLAIEVQRRSGIRTRQLFHHWLGEVLGLVALDCARRDEPLLVALCTDDAGRVGEGYAVAVRAASGDRPENPNAHAAKEQLECYRFFEAVGLPADGGSVAPPKVAAPATPRTRRAAAPKAPVIKNITKPAEIPPEICPTCFMAMPRSGVCENCGCASRARGTSARLRSSRSSKPRG